MQAHVYEHFFLVNDNKQNIGSYKQSNASSMDLNYSRRMCMIY